MCQLCNTVVTSSVWIKAPFLASQCRMRTEVMELTLLHDDVKGDGNFYTASLEQGE